MVKLCLDYLHEIDHKWSRIKSRGFNTTFKLHKMIYQTIINLANSASDLKKLLSKEKKTKEKHPVEQAPEKADPQPTKKDYLANKGYTKSQKVSP